MECMGVTVTSSLKGRAVVSVLPMTTFLPWESVPVQTPLPLARLFSGMSVCEGQV